MATKKTASKKKTTTKKKEEEKPPERPRTNVSALLEGAKSASELDDLLRFKGLITGPSGSGKTMLGARFGVGDRVFVAPTELQAIPSIQEANPAAKIFHNSKGEPGVRSSKDLQELRALLADPAFSERFDAFVLDSLTDCQRIIKDAYTRAQRSGRSTTDMDTWGLIVDLTARLAREVRDLPMDICVICLDEEKDVDGEGLVHRPSVSGKKLPSQLAQYFNVVGFAHKRETEAGEVRHQVLFRADDRFLTKGMTALDAVEPPEPLFWMHKRFDRPLPDDVAARVAAWQAMEPGEEEGDHELATSPTADDVEEPSPEEEAPDADDPFAAIQ